jgi:serine/threonine protein kinase
VDAPARQAGIKLRSPREINPKISQTVSDAVMAGLEMDYRKRPQSVEDFLSLLEAKKKPAVTVSTPEVALPGFEFGKKIREDFIISVYEVRKAGKSYHLITFKPPLDWKTKKLLLEIVGKLERIDHPNLVSLIDVYQQVDNVFLIYEEVSGMSLRERFKLLAPLNPSIAVDTAIAIGEALSALHKAGLAHGDLHPGNVVVTPGAHIKVLNAGILIPFQDYIKQGNLNFLMMRAPYAAPEIARGFPQSPQTDIYSLGVILFEALTGWLPFEGQDPMAIAVKQNKEPPLSPGKINPKIPRALEGVVLKALQKDLDKRYSTIKEVLTDLEEIKYALHYGYSLNWSPLDPKR